MTVQNSGTLSVPTGATRVPHTTLSPDDWLAALKWRYAVKQYDPTRRIDAATWNALEESLVLAPSSAGLQPYTFFVIDDKDVRARLREASRDQSPVTEADKFVVFAARVNFSEADVDRFVNRVAAVRDIPVASLEGLRNMGIRTTKRPVAVRDEWTARQAYIALGTFISAAAALGVDATPMEGFDPAQYDAILGLSDKGYRAVAVAAAGYRSPDDKYGHLPKVRFPRAEVVRHI